MVSREEWEALCKRCGKCCHLLIVTPEGKYIRDEYEHCLFFDEETKQCTVYKDRFMCRPSCREIIAINVPVYAESGFLPPDCGYIEDYKKGEKK